MENWLTKKSDDLAAWLMRSDNSAVHYNSHGRMLADARCGTMHATHGRTIENNFVFVATLALKATTGRAQVAYASCVSDKVDLRGHRVFLRG